ncbi:MAG: hydrolase [Chitinophagales bacterium]|nr:MAG: hydrolase [Chitinophagales bacterium]
MAVKNIIFDLGGVIIDLFPDRVVNMLKEKFPGRNFTLLYQHPLFTDLETGRIAPSEFRNQVRVFFQFHISDEEIDKCLNAMLGEIPPPRIEVLKKARQRYTTVLLSNTNPIHLAAIESYVTETYNIPRLDHLFYRTYYSHLVGLRKPDVRLFIKVLKENNFHPEETLFLDDTDANLSAAGILGIQTQKVTPETPLTDILLNC